MKGIVRPTIRKVCSARFFSEFNGKPYAYITDNSLIAGHVHGKYSYYDEAGYHELSYKAGAGIGFVVRGGNLAKPTQQLDTLTSYR